MFLKLNKKTAGLLLLASVFAWPVNPAFCQAADTAAVPKQQQTAENTAREGKWRLDGEKDVYLPRSFRKSSDGENMADINRDGLGWLRISGSGQMSLKGLDTVYRRIREESMAPIYLVDLRQEPHGYLNGVPVSWYTQDNAYGRGHDAAWVDREEQDILQSAAGHEITAVPLGNYDKEHLQPVVLQAVSAETEREAAEKIGYRYQRIAATDQRWPEPQAVDAFIAFYKTLPARPVWLHFHCHAGHGRTTTFMTMYDMMRNPCIPFEDIVKRQQAIGGIDLLATSNGSGWRAEAVRERAQRIRDFYNYVQENYADDYEISWSEWLKRKK